MAGFTQKNDTPLQTERKVQVAQKQLGFSVKREDLTIKQVQDRFTHLVKKTHPDSEEYDPDFAMGVNLDQVRQAKDYLVKHLESKNGDS